MKKLMILSTVAVAALSLAACKHDAPAGPVNEIGNEISLNSSDDLNTTAPDDAALNATVVDNATAIDTASNATAK